MTAHPSSSEQRYFRRTRPVRAVCAVLATMLALTATACGDDEPTASEPTADAAPTGGPGSIEPSEASDGGSDTEPPVETVTEAEATTTATSTAGPAATRTVDTEMGPVELPADPERILALDEYAALNLMALGIQPAEVWGSYQSEVGRQLIEAAGIPMQPGSVGADVNIEAVAAAQPDVIVVTAEGAFISVYPDLAEVAPTVILPYSRPWREVIEETARIFDRPAEADTLIAALERKIGEVSAVGETGPTSISLLGNTFGMLFAASNIAPISALLAEVGFTRPPAQAEGAPDPTFDAAVMISAEVLGEHDADLVAVTSGAYYDAAAIEVLPTFQALPAVVDGRSVVVDGDMWFGTYPFAIFWILEDLAGVRAGEGQDAIGTVDDTAERLAAFEDLLG